MRSLCQNQKAMVQHMGALWEFSLHARSTLYVIELWGGSAARASKTMMVELKASEHSKYGGPKRLDQEQIVVSVSDSGGDSPRQVNGKNRALLDG